MDTMTLVMAFAASVAVSAGVTLAFIGPIDDVLSRVIPAEMSGAWSRFVQFALFAASFAGGMRLRELAAFVAQRQAQAGAAAPAISDGQALLEVFRSITESLTAAAGLLLVFYASSLAVYAAARLFSSFRPSAAGLRAAARPAEPAADRPAERPERHHAAGAARAVALLAAVAGAGAWTAAARAAAPARGEAPARTEARQSWDEFRAGARRDFDRLDAGIESLEARARAEGAVARANADAQLQALRQQRTEASRALKKLESATEETRRRARDEVERALRELRSAYRRAVIRFERTPREKVP